MILTFKVFTELQTAAQPESMQQIVREIKEYYNTQSPNCAFQHIFYNLPAQPPTGPTPQPPNANPQLWQQGVSQNPEPRRLVPVVVSGFEGLKDRLGEQQKLLKAHEKAVEEIETFVVQTKRKHERGTNQRIEEFLRRHQELSHRLLKVICKLEALQSRGFSWYPEEETFHARLEHLQRELDKPTQFKWRLNELASQVSMLDDSPALSFHEQLEEASSEEAQKVLSSQTSSIKQLNSLLTGDLEEITIDLQALKTSLPRP
jgi:nuclear pore complex protein Nup54